MPVSVNTEVELLFIFSWLPLNVKEIKNVSAQFPLWTGEIQNHSSHFWSRRSIINKVVWLGETPTFSTEAGCPHPKVIGQFWSWIFNLVGTGSQLEKHSIFDLQLLFPLDIFSRYLKKIKTPEIFKLFSEAGHISFLPFEPKHWTIFVDFSEELLFSQCFPGNCLRRNMHESAVPIL